MIVPATRYCDPEAAIAFLCRALGFAEHKVYRDDDGRVMHAELTQGEGMIMLGPEADTPFARFMVPPRETGRRETTTIYVIVDDVAAHHARAVAAGAEIVMPHEDQPQGGSSYSVQDAEGHVWTFGDYDPRRAG